MVKMYTHRGAAEGPGDGSLSSESSILSSVVLSSCSVITGAVVEDAVLHCSTSVGTYSGSFASGVGQSDSVLPGLLAVAGEFPAASSSWSELFPSRVEAE